MVFLKSGPNSAAPVQPLPPGTPLGATVAAISFQGRASSLSCLFLEIDLVLSFAIRQVEPSEARTAPARRG